MPFAVSQRLSRRTKRFAHAAAARFISSAALASCLLLPAGVPGAASRHFQAKPAVLSYDWQTGTKHYFKVKAIFTGHFPPFAQPDSPAINLLADLNYMATVTQKTAQGMQVKFEVTSIGTSLLESEPGPDGKIDPDKASDLPLLSLSQAQEALNVTAVVRPDGSIAKVQGGKELNSKVDFGFDLRKLFLLVMPVTFSDKPVKVGDTWTYDDGPAGTQAGVKSLTQRL